MGVTNGDGGGCIYISKTGKSIKTNTGVRFVVKHTLLYKKTSDPLYIT